MLKPATREILAASGVIASLLFVGWEIRQNTIASRAAAYQSIGVATASLFDSTARDSAYLDALMKTPEDLTPQDWLRIQRQSSAYARLGETVILQIEEGLLPEDAVETLGYQLWKNYLQTPRGVCLWPSIRVGVSDSFTRFVEESQEPIEVDCSRFDLPDSLLVGP